MCQFFKKRSYPDYAITTGKHRTQEIDRENALQTKKKKRIPFTLTYYPQNLPVKNFIILRNDPESKHVFPLLPLSFKSDKT